MTTLDVAPTTTTATTTVRHRVGWIDGARGLSIVAMIVSHVDYVVGMPLGQTFHTVAMRPFAPIFLVLLGMLWRPGWRRRHWQLVGTAVASQVLALVLGFAFPNIIVLMLACILLLPVATRWPVVTLALCVTQLQFWTMPAWWTGYEPGFVLALATVGAAVPADGVVQAAGRLGSRLGLEVVGRMPVRFYLGHLLALVWASAVLGIGAFVT